MGLSFHCLSGSWMRCWKRFSCSSMLTVRKYLISRMPESIRYDSKPGVSAR